ncbi:MAG: SIS domain-containing protein [Candidatus Thermoplasmatota archaeon]|jgi:glucosamine--fructose-6-phosphate aminotransferase (isomerizing)|nr:SIS domain-containing protein [Candidatus Thermoplasmatota archaeon]MCL5790387.1 SIS domain-containing protein [Candidatus Thermoplasmatota archaeon]
MTDELPEIRRGHPYLMYEMLKETPEALKVTQRDVDRIDLDMRRSGVTVTGNGTSYHAGVLGFQFTGNNNGLWNSYMGYELANYYTPFPNILAVSHTGKTYSTMEAIRNHHDSQVIGITHYSESPLAKESSIPVIINARDRSLCNTKAFFDNVLASAIISRKISGDDYDFNGFIDIMDRTLYRADSEMKSVVSELEDIRNIFVLGAGYNFIAARETAQKLKEATHIHSEGIELEEYNHGCTSVTDKNTLIITISGHKDRDRTGQIVKGIRHVGSRSLTINGTGDFEIYFDTRNDFEFPIQSIAYTYYFAYHMAVKLKINPDILRFDEKEYYDFDMEVFPPGHH